MAVDPPVQRNLDPVYVRVVRGERHVDRCFSDLTINEQQLFLNSLDKIGLKRMAMVLAESLRHVGGTLDLHFDD